MTPLTDKQWVVISELLPRQNFKKGGRPRAHDRRTLNAILWILRTGAQWNELRCRASEATSAKAATTSCFRPLGTNQLSQKSLRY